jgi:Tfp pilus assembly protein PilO
MAMHSPLLVWRRRLWLWAIPLVFCLLNLFFFAYYRASLAGGVETLQARYDKDAEKAESLRLTRRDIQKFLDRVEANDSGVENLYGERFATESERFIQVLEESRRLARQAGLNPSSFSYPDEVLAEYGLIRREINFSVKGTYEELRTFINFLELSEQFLALEGVKLSGHGKDPRNPELNIQLRVSTVFKADSGALSRRERPAA